ncbi:hypothetical protein HWB76_gp044 [Streptomyces phage Blueeyedbeauty]|uniref:Uncharacterized protein n=1 Tax=Streptomyces phage Blueeyedbeauty TaxID=2250336 RepID=A0A345L254_9CAUD|nr:hypothetical protein HWB76_gp044 [Streptomyces phage Blueeyedbeauty]AXH49356.1 hypothetical protein SEA_BLUEEYEDBEAUTY_249 [Streptomyces phage Blueeyedbeauty]
MKKIVAKLRRNKDLNTFVVYMTNGKKFKVKAKNATLWYKTGTGICCDIKWEGRVTDFSPAPASVAALVKK